jgi:hypothetical protein
MYQKENILITFILLLKIDQPFARRKPFYRVRLGGRPDQRDLRFKRSGACAGEGGKDDFNFVRFQRLSKCNFVLIGHDEDMGVRDLVE